MAGRGSAGHDLQRPTANLAVGAEVLPPLGIYVARAFDATGAHPAVLYLGYAPTFVARRPPRPFLEVHLLDYQGDLYGRPLTAEFLEFIRPDRQFPDTGALRRQIQTDVAAARRWHARH